MTADIYSSTLGVLLMGTGNDNNSWGSNCNSAVFQIFEDAIANALTSAVTGGTLDLSGSPPPAAASQVHYGALIFSGTLASNQILRVPNLTKWWWVQNTTSGAFSLSIVTFAGSTQGSGGMLTLGTLTGGTLYTTGTYNNVPLTGGSGSGATANITVAGGAVTNVTIANRGKNYLVGDSVSASAANIGGTGSGFAIAVATVGNLIPQNSGWQLVQCDGNGNILVSPFNSQQVQMPDGTLSAPAYSNATEPKSGWRRAGIQDWRFVVNGADVLQITGTGASTPSVVNVLSPGALQVNSGDVLADGATMLSADGTVTAPGLAFNSEPATGFYRTALGDVGYSVLGVKRHEITSMAFSWAGNTIAGSDLSPTSFSTSQNNYNPPGLGLILTLGSITAGTGYVSGTYTNVPLTGGTGAGATATIVISGGGVTSVTITDRGLGYLVADALSASNTNLGGSGSGFSIPVSTVDALTGSCLRLNPTASCQLTGLAGGVAGREIALLNIGTATIQCPALSGSSSAANQFATAFNVVPGQSATLRYDATASLWRLKNAATAYSSCAMAAVSPDLLIVNDSGSPTTKVDITCGEAILTDASGNAIKFESVSVSITTTSTGPGGCDTGTRAASTGYFWWLVSDGVNINAVASTSSVKATMLSNLSGSGSGNYIYAKRVGGNFTDSSSNLYRVQQTGQDAHYVITPSTNTAGPPILASAMSASWASHATTGAIPATATQALVTMQAGHTSAVTVNAFCAPNANYAGGPSTTAPPFLMLYANSVNFYAVSGYIPLETAAVYTYAIVGGAYSNLFAAGWKDPV
jgi:hypothetical protein